MKLHVEPADGPSFERAVGNDPIIIGRASTSDLSLADPFLSRHHARLFQQSGELLVEDLGSRNGTELNGTVIGAPTAVKAGDVIQVSASRIKLYDDSQDPTHDRPISDFGATILRSASELLKETELDTRPDVESGTEDLRRYAERLHLLNRVHEALASSLSLEDLLQMILERAFEQLDPEDGVIFLEDQTGYSRAASHSVLPNPEPVPLARSLIEEVCDKGMAAIVMDTALDERFAGAESIISSGMRSILAVPMLAEGRSLGMIVVCSRVNKREFTTDDMELLVTLASIAAMRIRNARLAHEAAQRKRLEEELALARRIQESLLPSEVPQVPGYDLFAQNLPSRGVSGDYYSLVNRKQGSECALFIADVSGKGMPAAMLTSSLEALAAGPIEDGIEPAEICELLCRRLYRRSPPEKYATAFLAMLEPATGVVRYTNAGHNPALVVRLSGEIEQLPSSGMPIALVPRAKYTQSETSLAPGDTLVFYTDGITEAEDPDDEEYGLERLEELVRKYRDQSSEDLAEWIQKDLEVFVRGRTPADDRTLIIVSREA